MINEDYNNLRSAYEAAVERTVAHRLEAMKDDLSMRIADLRAQVSELDRQIAAKQAKIAELEQTTKQKEANLQTLKEKMDAEFANIGVLVAEGKARSAEWQQRIS